MLENNHVQQYVQFLIRSTSCTRVRDLERPVLYGRTNVVLNIVTITPTFLYLFIYLFFIYSFVYLFIYLYIFVCIYLFDFYYRCLASYL